MFVYSYKPKKNLSRIIAFDTCCDATHTIREMFLKIFKDQSKYIQCSIELHLNNIYGVISGNRINSNT